MWSWCLAPKWLTVPSVWSHELQLRGLWRRCCCRRCSSIVTALLTSLLPRRRCFSLVVVAASFADPVAASPLRVPWTLGILGLLGMPFHRDRHLIRVIRPIGSSSRHTPVRMRFSVPGGRIRARRAYLPRRTRPCLHLPFASKHLRAYAPQDLWQTRGFGVASPLTKGDML